MAQRNQTNRLPLTASFPWLATAASTSASDTASAGKAQQTAIAAIPGSKMTSFRKLDLCITPPYNASGFARNSATMLVNSLRHQAFMTSKNN